MTAGQFDHSLLSTYSRHSAVLDQVLSGGNFYPADCATLRKARRQMTPKLFERS